MTQTFDTTRILGVPYAELDYTSASSIVLDWASERSARVVVVAPVSSLILARSRTDVGAAFARADMIASDGMPIVWARRLLGRREASRLYGPDLMLRIVRDCAQRGVPIALLGGRPERLDGLRRELLRRHPELWIAFSSSPPFRELTDEEVAQTADAIESSGARVVFVATGSPKQELLMARLADRLLAVQLGVGAAFDFIPGYVRQAPAPIQKAGLEWAFRVACEPRRLWKRYATTIPPFMIGVTVQLIVHHVKRLAPQSGAQSA